jgi:RNA polymerase sigma-70 factor (ECF subfamily)
VPLESRIRAALARGEPDAAAEEAIRGYGPQVLGYLTRVLGSADDAADAFSYFSERVWKGMAGFEGRSSVRVWLYRVAWTAALRVADDGFRRRRERLRTSMASRLAAEVMTRAAADVVREDEGMDRLRRALEPAERALLVLRLDQRLSWREVAEVLRADGEAVDEAALRKRFERVKEKLARLARDEGLIE